MVCNSCASDLAQYTLNGADIRIQYHDEATEAYCKSLDIKVSSSSSSSTVNPGGGVPGPSGSSLPSSSSSSATPGADVNNSVSGGDDVNNSISGGDVNNSVSGGDDVNNCPICLEPISTNMGGVAGACARNCYSGLNLSRAWYLVI